MTEMRSRTISGVTRSVELREWLLEAVDGDFMYPTTKHGFRYVFRNRDGSEDHSVAVLRMIYTWLPVLKDAGYHVPKLASWDPDWGGDSAMSAAQRALDGQLKNASPGQLAQYEMVYRARMSWAKMALKGEERAFVKAHLSTPWEKGKESTGKPSAKKHEQGGNPTVHSGHSTKDTEIKEKGITIWFRETHAQGGVSHSIVVSAKRDAYALSQRIERVVQTLPNQTSSRGDKSGGPGYFTYWFQGPIPKGLIREIEGIARREARGKTVGALEKSAKEKEKGERQKWKAHFAEKHERGENPSVRSSRVVSPTSRKAGGRALFVTLSASPNYDFGPGSHQATIRLAPRRQKVASLADASRVAQLFIREHELGSGNWTGGLVTDQAGKSVARVSYNGRVWSLDAKQETPLEEAAPLHGAATRAFARRRAGARASLEEIALKDRIGKLVGKK